jgi:hypothetical protein
MLARMIVASLFALGLVLGPAACGKKQAPKAPAAETPELPQAEKAVDEEAEADDAGAEGADELRGDPCDGGE